MGVLAAALLLPLAGSGLAADTDGQGGGGGGGCGGPGGGGGGGLGAGNGGCSLTPGSNGAGNGDGGAGALGGTFNAGIAPGGAGGAGGTAGTAGAPTGGTGGTGIDGTSSAAVQPGSGGGGGGGGAGVVGSVLPAGTIIGGTGGIGGNSGTAAPGGSTSDGGGGGGGGAGAILSGGGSTSTAGTITGGTGGLGGNGASVSTAAAGLAGGPPGYAGHGGFGGAAIISTGVNVSNGFTITGGLGGNGGVNGNGGDAGTGGGAGGGQSLSPLTIGGNGGSGVTGSGFTLTNTGAGVIIGGNGGTAGAAGNGGNGDGGAGGNGGDGSWGGAGGAGVNGTGINITNAGLITGGDAGVSSTGGTGGTGTTGGAGGNGGPGTLGGAGIVDSGATIINTGTIQGGNGAVGAAGGAGGVGGTAGTTGSAGASGAGGIGVTGGDLAVITSGTIAGGLGSAGTGARANAVTFTSGTNALELQAGFTMTGNVQAFSTADSFRLGGATNAGFDVALFGAQYLGFGVFQKTGTSTWTLAGASTEVTPWTILQGTLSVASDAMLGDASGTLTLDGGILQVTGAAFTGTPRPVVLGANGGGFDIVEAGTAFTLTQALSGVGAVEKLGAGTLVMTGDNTYTGGTTISGGTLQLGAGGTTGSITGNVLNNATLAFNRSDVVTFAGVISGTGAVRQDGTGTTILTGENTYAGGTTISAGTLQLGAGGTSGSIVGNVLNNATLTFNRSDTVTYAGVISGTGAVRQEGSGTTILTGENTYTGGTTITTGTLQLGDGGTTGSILGNVVNNSLHSLVFNRSNTLVFAGVISGIGAVRQEGTGTTILTGANTYSGPTTVNAGTLQAGATNTFSPNSSVTVATAGTLALAGFDQTIPGLTNAGLVSLGGAPGTRLTVAGNYVGQGGVLALNTFLGGDSSVSDRLVISGGTATGDTRVRITNIGGPGAQTVEGIRVVETANGGTTAAGAFRLDTRVAAGAFEYRLFRGGNTSTDDWFLRSFTDPVTPGTPDTPTLPSSPAIPLYRPEVALYAPIAAIGRQMGLATLGTLHERVGELDNIRDLTGSSPYANGAWARAFGERTRNRWDGTVDARATGNLIGLQAGFDILRTQPYAGGHRDHAGVYVAYTDYNAPNVSGFALGQRNLQVGRLLMSGPSVGAYWTHFGPSGWYVDAVFQANWFDVKASSDFGTAMNTNGVGYTASLEAGYPIRFGGGWQIEPQAQIIWQSASVDRSRDLFSSVDWNEDDAVTARLGARLQYTGRDERTLWQPYAKVNLWHAFSGTDRVSFGSGTPIENRFGQTALEVGAGITARVNQTTSFYAHADYRWAFDGDSRGTAVQGAIGIRFNW